MKIKDIFNGEWVVQKDPILCFGKKGEWDDWAVMTPAVFRDESRGKYSMFYAGVSVSNGNWGIGYAESEDLINWQKYPENPLLIYKDQKHLYQLDGPCIVKKDETFYLFCEEKEIKRNFNSRIKPLIPLRLMRILRKLNKFRNNASQATSHAEDRYLVQFESKDILNYWDINNKKIVFKKNDNLNTFDSRGVFSPQIYYIDGIYYLFYGGSDGRKTRSGLATSCDMVNWKRAEYNPILDTGKKGDWDEENALIVSILKVEDGYVGFYEGEDRYNKYRIGIAYSYDLEKWEKFSGNPIVNVGNRGDFNENIVCSPHVFMTYNGRLVLYFSANDKDMRGYCGMASFKNF